MVRSARGPIVALLLMTAVLLLNANALQAFFAGDDFEILRRVVPASDLGDALRVTFNKNWGPLSYGQFYLNYRVAGFDPLVYHLTNLLWLSLLAVALHAFLRSTWPAEPWTAWAAALLFLTHPANEQAVANICGRSHVIGAALAVVALSLYAHLRLGSVTPTRRAVLLAGALLSAFLAGLSKETAMTLPAWIAGFELLIARGERDSFGRAVLRAAGAAVLFVLAALSVFVVRALVVGGSAPKLAAASPQAGISRPPDLAAYALISGLPFPFGWADLPELRRLQALGWIVILVAFAAGVACFYARSLRARMASKACGLYVVGLIIATTTIAPVVYADVQLQRRYVFFANIGSVLMAVAVLYTLRRRFPRAASVLLAIMLLAGAIGTVQRNDLYRRGGEVVRNLVEAVREAPMEELPKPDERANPDVVLVTLPRYYGGDRASGAIMLHDTDLRAALRLLGSQKSGVEYALRCYYADDYSAQAEFLSDRTLEVTVSFRSRRSYRAAAARVPEDDGEGDSASARLIFSDADARILRYIVVLEDDFWEEHGVLLLYSDGEFTRLTRPAPL